MRLNSALLISIIAFGAVLAALLVLSVGGVPASGPGSLLLRSPIPTWNRRRV